MTLCLIAIISSPRWLPAFSVCAKRPYLYAPVVEFKYAQGAKPGLGGHLLGDKVTPEVAKIRETVVGSSLFSPFPFHSVYSVEDHKKHLDWIKEINPRALIPSKSRLPPMRIWWQSAVIMPELILFILTAVTAAPAPLRISPRRILPCLLNMLSLRYTAS